jgi:hypothetical protein
MADTPVTDITKLSKSTQATIAANAQSQGITPEAYLKQRGGLYGSGYYGDTPEFRRLGDEEYAKLTKEGGAEAINAALLAKRRAAFIANPSLIENRRLRLAYQNGTITIDDVLNAELPGSASKAQTTFEPIGAMADGTPIYGYGSDGKPVTSPTGAIYSTASSSDAVTKFSSGSSPLTTSSSTTATGVTGTTDKGRADRQSAYDLLYGEFERYGLQSLVEPLKGLIISGASPSEFTIKLRETDAYKKRFAANDARIKSGLRALSEAEYIRDEDLYQEVMRRRGLPAEYYAKGDLGVQKGFEALIAGDVSSSELEDRIVTAQDRVLNANPEIARTLKEFYPNISNGDILAYVLDPANAINVIKRKIMTAEIGAAAKAEGLTSGLPRAEELATAGVTGEGYRKAAPFISEATQRGSQLSEFYKEQPYTQATAEAEVLNLAGATEAAKQRNKIKQLESASFSGRAGAGAIARDRAGVL